MGGVPVEVPASAWVLAWTCLISQLANAAHSGLRPLDFGALVSVCIGGPLITWFSAGVLRARTGRVVFVWIVFALMAIVGPISLLDAGADELWVWASILFLVTQIASLAWFTNTAYYRWQRTRPTEPGPSLTGLLVIAFIVGVLAGAILTPGANDGGVHIGVRL